MAISTELLNLLLAELHATSSTIQASAIVSTDGLLLAGRVPDGVDADRVAAMGAAMLSQGGRTARELARGGLEQVTVKTAKGYVLLLGMGRDALLIVMTSNEAKLGLIFLAIQETAELLAGFDLKPPPRAGLVALKQRC